jgi:hypothetical protein
MELPVRMQREPDRSADGAAADVLALFDQVVRHRDHLAGLGPLSRQELDIATLALHEAVLFFLTRRVGQPAKDLKPQTINQLAAASRARTADPFTLLVAILAMKLATPHKRLTPSEIMEGLTDILDTITFDVRATKRSTLALLSQARKEVDERIARVK